MKKSLLVLGVAVAALASCTNEEVTEVAQNSAIGFSSFVNNATKTVDDLTKANIGTNFYVIGFYGATGTGPYTNPVFKNELSTTTYYWKAGNTFQFAAYANGIVGTGGAADDVKLDGVAYTYDGDLTISDYTVNDANDLVVAISDQQECTSATGNNAVGLTFKHALSKVRFTFKTNEGENHTLKISGLTFTANTKGNLTYATATGAAWAGQSESAEYKFDEIADLTVSSTGDDNTLQSDGSYQKSVEKLVLPQAVPADAGKITVSFTATLTGDDIEGEKTGTFTADLVSTTDNAWKAGYVYNYAVEINGDDIDPTLEDQKIEFTVDEVTDWTIENPTITPSKQN